MISVGGTIGDKVTRESGGRKATFWTWGGESSNCKRGVKGDCWGDGVDPPNVEVHDGTTESPSLFQPRDTMFSRVMFHPARATKPVLTDDKDSFPTPFLRKLSKQSETPGRVIRNLCDAIGPYFTFDADRVSVVKVQGEMKANNSVKWA